MNTLITFIIPAYNAERYIKRCIESILRLDKKYNIEVLVIDDGSKDNTYEIVMSVAKCDARVKVISQYNQGVSAARNNGISTADGVYIFCVDADDELDADNFAQVYKAAESEKYDVIAADYKIFSEDGSFKEVKSLNVTDADPKRLAERYIAYPIIGDLSQSKTYLGAKVYQYAIKKSLLSENNIRFPQGVHYAEDLCFLYNVMQCADTMKYVPLPAYNYYIIGGSASHKYRESFHKELMEVCEYIIKINKLPLDEHNLRAAFRNNVVNYYIGKVSYSEFAVRFRALFCNDRDIYSRIYISDAESRLRSKLYSVSVRFDAPWVLYWYSRINDKIRMLFGKISKRRI